MIEKFNIDIEKQPKPESEIEQFKLPDVSELPPIFDGKEIPVKELPPIEELPPIWSLPPIEELPPIEFPLKTDISEKDISLDKIEKFPNSSKSSDFDLVLKDPSVITDQGKIETFNFEFNPDSISFDLNDNETTTAENQEISDDVEKSDEGETLEDNDTAEEVKEPEKNVVQIDGNVQSQEEIEEILNSELEPNTIYVLENGDTYETDSQGRVIKAEFTLTIDDLQTSRERDGNDKSNTREVGKQGIEGDQGGHIKAHQFGGTSDKINLFPQNGNFNQGEYKRIENGIAKDLQEGKTVKVTVELIYDNKDSSRPDKVKVTKEVSDQNGNVEVTVYTNKNAPKEAQDA